MHAVTFLPGRFGDFSSKLAAGPFDLNAKLACWSERISLPQLVPYIWTYGDNGSIRVPIKRPEVHEKGILRFAEVLRNPQHESSLLIQDVESSENSLTPGYLVMIGHANDYSSQYRCEGDNRWLLSSWLEAAPSKSPFFREWLSLWAVPIGATLTIRWCAAEIDRECSELVPLRKANALFRKKHPELNPQSLWEKIFGGFTAHTRTSASQVAGPNHAGTPLFRIHFDQQPRIELATEAAELLPRNSQVLA